MNANSKYGTSLNKTGSWPDHGAGSLFPSPVVVPGITDLDFSGLNVIASCSYLTWVSGFLWNWIDSVSILSFNSCKRIIIPFSVLLILSLSLSLGIGENIHISWEMSKRNSHMEMVCCHIWDFNSVSLWPYMSAFLISIQVILITKA